MLDHRFDRGNRRDRRNVFYPEGVPVIVKATHVLDFEGAKNPGDFFITSPDVCGNRRLSFLCPCGCGVLCGIRVRDDGTTLDRAWAWDRNRDAPTCTPSILINQNHWHGYLTNGEFVSC